MVSEKKIVFGFPHYNTMGAIRCHGTQSFNLIWQEHIAAFPPP